MTVCAIILTFHPDLHELEQSFLMLSPQVQMILVIDNASHAELREPLRALARKYRCTYVQNEDNVGVATGLNQGVRFTEEAGVDFVLLLDQDSTVNDGFVAAQLVCFAECSRERKIGVVAPVVVNCRSGFEWHPLPGADGNPLMTQTSGSLMPISIFREVGYFPDDLFIDYVDYEYNLRMRMAGWWIAEAKEARLTHMPGVNSPVRLFGRQFYAINASPLRQYYRMRNLVWMLRHYWRNFPSTCRRLVLSCLKEYLKILLLEDQRWAKVEGSVAGLRDGLLGHMGRRGEVHLNYKSRKKYSLLKPRA